MKLFITLQLVDVATTLAGFKLGAFEVSPVLSHLFSSIGPVTGLLTVKALAILAAGIAVWYGVSINKANTWFALLGLWNMAQLFIMIGAR